MFDELLRQPGVIEQSVLRSRFGFLALHGGSLERGTAEVAWDAAERGGASVYAVCQPEDLRWHIPSRLVSRDASPRLAGFLDHVEVIVSLHGYGRPGFWTTVLVGGANRPLAQRVGAALRAALPGYEVVDDIHAIPSELRGLNPANPVNHSRSGGVQIELPPRVRDLVPGRDGSAARARLIEALAVLAAAEATPTPLA